LSRKEGAKDQEAANGKNTKHKSLLIKYKYDKKAAYLSCILLEINEKAPMDKLKIGAFIVQKAQYFLLVNRL
jgi:hypothetical protein